MIGQLPVDIYARVSRKGDKEQRSTGGQVAVCRSVLVERGLPEGETFVDDGTSAWNPRVTRKDWDALMARLESGVSGGVIVFDLERFARQIDDGQRLVKAAKRGLVVLDSDSEYDLTTASGEKAFNDAMSAAVYYSHRLSDRIKRGKKLKALEGEFNGAHRPFGFVRLPGGKGLDPHPEEAPVLREIVARFLAGEPQETIAADLNARGVHTAGAAKWTRSAIRQVLRRPVNAGLVVHDGAPVARLAGDPVIDPADFDRVQTMLDARRPGRPNSPKYVCSGVAACVCGARLAGRPRPRSSPYPDGEVRREYWCSPWTYGGCGRTYIDQRTLDAEARELTITILSDPRHASQIEAAAAQAASEAAELDVKIAADEQLAVRLADRLGRLEISLDRYDAAVAPIDKRLAELRARRATVELGEAIRGVRDLAASAETWAARWDVAEPAERSTLLRMALRGRRLVIAPRTNGTASRITISD